MSVDAKLTKLTGALLVAVRDHVDHLIGSDYVDKEQLRVTLAPAARKAKAEELKEQGLSQRQIGAALGVDHKTICNDLRGENSPKCGENSPLLEAPAPRGKAEILAAAKQIRAVDAIAARAVRVENIAEISKGNKELGVKQRFPIIYADPPWRFENPPMGSSSRSAENHFPTMTIEEICALPVCDLAADDALLYLWATAPKLAECMRVIEAWGFDYRTNFVWVKDKIGMGYHARNQHELLLVAKRGSIPPPAVADRVSSVVRGDRAEHSEKPLAFYELIESFYPQLAKIELFSRAPRDGWEAWGNQASWPQAAE